MIFVFYVDTLLSTRAISRFFIHDYHTIADAIDEFEAAFLAGFPAVWSRYRGKGGVEGHLAVTHSDTYVIGDAHTSTFENRHSFLRQWLANFRSVSKHHLQKYLNFLALKLNSPEDWFEKLLCYNVSE